jgi:tRNA nucleotidyltransferase (CCA-adding enzyme)
MQKLAISPHLIHPSAVEICHILHDNGYQAFIVGGCVRDLLLGQKPKDWDITSDAHPETVIQLFPKTIPTGLQHGTVTVCMGDGVENQFEVTTFRIEGEYSDGRRPDVVLFVANVDQDLARRDLTINAIAYNPITERIFDPFHGIDDLQAGLIKAVGNATARFQEDGLRIMRVARFAARFNYVIDPDTFRGMTLSLETLQKVSKERIRDELCKTLMANNPDIGLRILSSSGALKIASPILNYYPSAGAFPWSGELETRVACLYIHHPMIMVEQELNNLKFSGREIKKIMLLQELFDRYLHAKIRKTGSEPYKSIMSIIKNRSIDDCPSTLEQFIKLCEAMGQPIQEWLEIHQKEVVYARREMEINGDDLLAIGMAPGPKIKKALDACYAEILRNHKQNSKGKLIQFIRERLLY